MSQSKHGNQEHALRAARFGKFCESYPGYASTAFMDELRAKEYSRLDALKQVYLDYTGGSLYAQSQIEEHRAMLEKGVYGNPHSSNPTSQAATKLVDATRDAVLAHFNADPAEYTAVFTANASGALKIVGESYPFAGGRYLLSFDNHNSVNGIREFAKMRGAPYTYIPLNLSDLRISEERLVSELEKPEGRDGHRLFAYPAQSNFSAVQHPLEWVALAQAKGWDVLLDAAAFAQTLTQLSGEAVQAHFRDTREFMARVGAQGFPTFVLETAEGLQSIDVSAYLGRPQAFQERLRQRAGLPAGSAD